ncbi:MAG: hypothetical protein N3G74_02085 [Candidatus Micrarchaeota archaeon]|nr:hypothetical protein [Candidatus Micrarchaeota archaeon]
MKAQLSLEFLLVMGAYAVFIFIIVSALDYSNLLGQIREQEFSLRVRSLQLIETQRLINNKFTDMKLFMEGCVISESSINTSVICRLENITRSEKIPLKDSGNRLLALYRPIS